MKTATALIAALLIVTPAFAQTVHKCVDANGKVSFQQIECPGQGKKIEIPTSDTDANDGSLAPEALHPSLAPYARGRYVTTQTDACQTKELLTTPDGKKYYLNEKNQRIECPATTENTKASENSRSTGSAVSSAPITTSTSNAGKTAKSSQRPSSSKTSGDSGRVWHTGPRGGEYYYNSKGNKVYRKKK